MRDSSKKYEMSFKEIAQQLTAEEGIKYTEDQVRQIYCRAMKKLRRWYSVDKSVTN